MKTKEKSNALNLALWVISSLILALFLFSAIGKFMHLEQMEQMHLGNWRLIIAIGEIVSVLMFFFPKTNLYGTFLLSSYLGGAIILHMTGGISILMPSFILVLVWVVGFLRNPSLLKS